MINCAVQVTNQNITELCVVIFPTDKSERMHAAIYIMYNCTARQCSPLRRKFMECYIIKPAQSLLMTHLVIGQR